MPHNGSVRVRMRYNSQATGTQISAPVLTALLEKSSVGGLKKSEVNIKLRPLAPYPIDVAYDLATAGSDCLFVTKTGLPYSSGYAYFQRPNGELVELGKSFSGITETIARDRKLAEEIMDALDNWTPRETEKEVVGRADDDGADEAGFSEE